MTVSVLFELNNNANILTLSGDDDDAVVILSRCHLCYIILACLLTRSAK